ncbi:hypothetical protein Glove_75g54 [Diversispora epigaea]|uniref:Uncharacterized protein n=1 Tax=Diversispora epigaea TaxID=1348612 RepID=A0A397JCC5_9GLOM|nr:hypothetical protein Glove_75g54 [Diversispora epigaea]
MINSILDIKPRRITLDRVIDRSKQEIKIITDPSKVKSLVRDHLFQWTKKETAEKRSINEQWAKQYEPREDINNTTYSDLIKPIDSEEIIASPAVRVEGSIDMKAGSIIAPLAN